MTSVERVVNSPYVVSSFSRLMPSFHVNLFFMRLFYGVFGRLIARYHAIFCSQMLGLPRKIKRGRNSGINVRQKCRETKVYAWECSSSDYATHVWPRSPPFFVNPFVPSIFFCWIRRQIFGQSRAFDPHMSLSESEASFWSPRIHLDARRERTKKPLAKIDALEK